MRWSNLSKKEWISFIEDDNFQCNFMFVYRIDDLNPWRKRELFSDPIIWTNWVNKSTFFYVFHLSSLRGYILAVPVLFTIIILETEKKTKCLKHPAVHTHRVCYCHSFFLDVFLFCTWFWTFMCMKYVQCTQNYILYVCYEMDDDFHRS